MPDLCTAVLSPTGCGHLTITIAGETFPLHEHDVSLPLSADERQRLWIDLLRIWRHERGVSALAAMVGRAVRGDEATNVKQYDILGPGSAVTKTNIGTTYVDVLPGANGQRVLVDFTGCTEFRLILSANLVGTGQWGARLVRDSDAAVLYEQASLGAAGERELDTDWQPLPAQANGLTLVRLQAKSTTAADDPVFRRCVLVVR